MTFGENLSQIRLAIWIQYYCVRDGYGSIECHQDKAIVFKISFNLKMKGRKKIK